MNKKEIEVIISREVIKEMIIIYSKSKKKGPHTELDLYALLFMMAHFALVYAEVIKRSQFKVHKNLNLEKILNYSVRGVLEVIVSSCTISGPNNKTSLLH